VVGYFQVLIWEITWQHGKICVEMYGRLRICALAMVQKTVFIYNTYVLAGDLFSYFHQVLLEKALYGYREHPIGVSFLFLFFISLLSFFFLLLPFLFGTA
jgi:hypothetical protein